MGSYKEIKGDLIELAKKGEFDLIAHGCNCFATMGAGIAKTIKANFPEAFRADKKYRARPSQRLGNMTVAVTNNNVNDKPLIVANLYTQFMPGPDYNYTAIAQSFINLTRAYKGSEIKRIGIPLIGCGIAGGDWKMVKRIVKSELKDFDVTVVIFDKNE
jgi:O-acetyl-ADP-ribose deacetylase (regulator of RNase III)